MTRKRASSRVTPGTQPTSEKKKEDFRAFIDDVKVLTSDKGKYIKLETDDGVKEVIIKKLKISQYGEYLELTAEIIEDLGISSLNSERISKGLSSNPARMLKVLGKYMPRIPGLIAGVTSLEAAESDELEPDDVLKIAAAVWEVNKHFLSKMGLLGNG